MTVQARRELAPVPGTRYVAFVDPSGGSQDSFTVAVKGGQIKVLRVRPEGGPKISAGQFAAEAGFVKGAKLG